MFLLCFVATPLIAQNLRGPSYVDKARQGFDYIHNLEYEKANRIFSELRQGDPKHPGPPLNLAVTLWLQELFEREDLDLDKFIAPGYFTKPATRKTSTEKRESFFQYLEESQRLSRAVLEEYPNNKDARFFLGSAEGVLGAFAITIDRSKTAAFGHGKRAYNYHKELVEEDPEYFDAYMTIGTYEYIVDNLPWYIKWLAVIIGYRGSEERGFEYLKRTAEKGLLGLDDARVLMMVLYVREKAYAYALEIARYLHRKFPRNFLLHLNEAQILEMMRERKQAVEAYSNILELAGTKKPNYQKLPLARFRYSVGEKFMKLGRPDLALEQFEASIRDPETPKREEALSHLRAGEILDQLGKREDARSQYQQVLELADVDSSHKMARRCLKKRYKR